MSCERLRSLWETFLDGELPTGQVLELQAHLDACSDCSESLALSDAIRRTARQVVYDDAPVTDAFRARLQAALVSEARDEHDELERARRRRWLSRAPQASLGAALAIAAALLLWMRPDEAKEQGGDASAPGGSADRELHASHMLGPQELLDLFIDYHTAPPAPEVTEPKLVPELERDVGVKVPFPSLAAYGAEWQGGSLVHVPRTKPAAYLRYRTRDSHSVTVYVYNASRIPLHASLKQRMFREEPVYERSWRGYSIAAQLRQGVGYAVATDLDEARSAELVNAITRSVVQH
jgi:anti-sigma factor RsiW